MAYSHATWADLKRALALRLNDEANVRYADEELGLYLAEALHMLAALGWYWRERAEFPTTAGAAFYDLNSVLAPALMAPSITDRTLVKQIQYHLLEPATGNSWTGTEQFTLEDVTKAIQRRRNQFLLETGLVLSYHETDVGAPPPVRIPLPDTVIDIRHMDWKTVDGVYFNLTREDEYNASMLFDPAWNLTPGTPLSFSLSVTPPVTLELIPPRGDAGKLSYLSIDSGPALDPETAETILGIPDDWVWVVKYGALGDLLSKDGPARDSKRAAYCDRRWKDGIAAAKVYTSVLLASVNDASVILDEVTNLDSFNYGWRNSSNRPDVAALAGYNMLALAPVPDAAYGITADLVRKGVIPANDDEFVQIGREVVDVVLNAAEHIAYFKDGAYELSESADLGRSLWMAARLMNDRLAAIAGNIDALSGVAMIEEKLNKRQVERAPAESEVA